MEHLRSATVATSKIPTLSGEEEWQMRLGHLQKVQNEVPSDFAEDPRCPKQEDLLDIRTGFSVNVFRQRIDRRAKHCLILLYCSGSEKVALEELALRIQEELEETVCILLRLPNPHMLHDGGSHTDSISRSLDQGLPFAEEMLGKMIKQILILKCHFPPRSLVLLGHGEAATAALNLAILWNRVEFGGIIAMYGTTRVLYCRQSRPRAKTPALIIGRSSEITSDNAMGDLESYFDCLDFHGMLSEYERRSERADLQLVVEFLGHRLREDEWNKQAILTLDGGGIRGYGSLLILQALMNKIGEEETVESSFAPYDYKPTRPRQDDIQVNNEQSLDSPATEVCASKDYSSLFLPCHYFTYIAGTSTGGLISIMLSRLRMTVDDCIKEYETLGNDIFGHRRLSLQGVLRPKYSSRALETLIDEVSKRHSTLASRAKYCTQREDDDLCRCIVLAYPENFARGDIPYLFRSYHSPLSPFDPAMTDLLRAFENNLDTQDITLPLASVARSTSAAPRYFKPMKVWTGWTSPKLRFKDGGFGSNNPSLEVYHDVIQQHGGDSKRIGPFVSIGTGIPKFTLFSKSEWRLRDLAVDVVAAMKIASLTTNTHKYMQKHSIRDGTRIFPYFRFDGGHNLGKIKLDEWEPHGWITSLRRQSKNRTGSMTLQKIRAAMREYLVEREVDERLTNCARVLVQRRRLRQRNAAAWQRYAMGSCFICDNENCTDPTWYELSPLGPLGEIPTPKRVTRFNLITEFENHLCKVHSMAAGGQEIDGKIRSCRCCSWIYPSERVG